MPSDPAVIQNVSDTAIWVAHYRAVESERPDALFRDELASVLTGTRGRQIAEAMKRNQMTGWSVVIRTAVIDALIQKLVSEGVDTVVNLGAGLDTRPWRLALPQSLHWIEVDYPGIITHKETLLARHPPRVQLEQISLDLANIEERRKLFARIAAGAQRVLVLTEGVIPYLTEEQVSSLAADLHAEEHFCYWIAEYYSPRLYQWMRSKKRTRQFRNAPLQFLPADWMGLFRTGGWTPREIRWLAEESTKMGRRLPLPWWVRLLFRMSSKERAARASKFMGYVVFGRDNP